MVVVGFSCEEDDTGSPRYGTASAVVEGEASSMRVEQASESLCLEQRVHIAMSVYDPVRLYTNSISLANVPLIPGEYSAQAVLDSDDSCEDIMAAGLYMLVADGDAIADVYEVIKGDESLITVTSYDAGRKELRGTFQLSFTFRQLRDRQKITTAPDTVHFTQGEFQVFVE